MTDAAAPDPTHFTRAVTQLGDKHKVVSSAAIFNAQGIKVIEKGVTVDARLYERLTQHQLRQPLDQCVEVESTVNGAALRDAAQVLIQSEPFFGAVMADERLRETLLEELAQVPLPRPIAFQLTLARETQPELWQHSLRSALLAGWLIARRDGTRHDMRMLAAAGLLHDLGMLHIDPVLMQPTIQLDRGQRRQLYTHPLVSVMLLERHHEFPRPLLSAVLEHHERLDGSGYPRSLRGASQGLWGRVLALCELVTAMVGSAHASPMFRLSVVLRMNRHRFDPLLVAEVARVLDKVKDADPPPPTEGAVADLTEIDRLLRAWPTSLDEAERQHEASLAHVQDQCGQVLRQLADAGVSAEQLASLGDGEADPALASELAVILMEATWQLRLIARQARRRWAIAPADAYPSWLSEWLAAVDGLCDRRLGTVEAPPAAAPSPAPEATEPASAG